MLAIPAPASSAETVLLDTITPAIAADNYGIYGVWHTQWEGQRFSGNFSTITAVEWGVLAPGHSWHTLPNGTTLEVKLYANGAGSSLTLLASKALTLPFTPPFPNSNKFVFDTPVDVSFYNDLTVALAVPDNVPGEYETLFGSVPPDYDPGGTRTSSPDQGATWSADPGRDQLIRIYGEPEPVAVSAVYPPLPEQCGDPGTVYRDADMNLDCLVNEEDFALFSGQWLASDCAEPDDCAGADLDVSGTVVFPDYSLFAADWQMDSDPANIPLAFRVLGTTIPPDTPMGIPPGFVEQFLPTNTTLPSLTSEEANRGYVIFRQNYLEEIYPRTRPLQEELTDSISTFCSIGEYEPVTFAVHAFTDMTGVTVQVDDLVGPAGVRLDARNIEVRTVRCLPRRIWNQDAFVVQPTLLEKPADVSIERNRTQQYWVTVYCPLGTPGGLYTGTIHIQPAGMDPFGLQLHVDVLPFELMESPVRQGMYYAPADFLTSNPLASLSPTRIRRDILNMKTHGMDTLFMSIPPFIETGQDAGGPWMNLDPFINLETATQESGLTVIYNTTIDPIAFDAQGDFATMLQVFLDEFTLRGWPLPILSAGDESDANGSLAAVQNWLSIIRQTQPQRTTYTTIVFPANSELYEPDLDIRAFSSWMDDTAVAPTQSAGRQLWMYSGSSGYGKDTKGDRLYRGFWAAALELEGMLDWTYFRPGDWSKPFNDLVGAGGRPNFDCWVFPGQDGPLPSPGWEDLREGDDDGNYIFTLKTLIQQATQSGDSGLIALAQTAQNDLNQIVGQVNTSPPGSGFPVSQARDLLPTDYFQASRLIIAQHIIAIQQDL
jgi:hypothetical protein